ncbi:MAG: radical SAM protein [Anaerohalosphaeraceae bacterium]
MQSIEKAWCGHVDITNVCRHGCVYCTRYDRHLGPKKYMMSLDDIEAALISYTGFPGRIGIMGGEPQFHKQFDEVCRLVQKHIPKDKPILFTSVNPATSKWSDVIRETFPHTEFHPHTEEQESTYEHQPLTIACADAVKDKALRQALIEDCWVQRKWCPTVTDDGAFFCEIGASLAKLTGMKGWPLKQDGRQWWKRTPSEFGDQLDLCQLCGMCIPMKRQKMADKKQKISPSFLKVLEENGLPVGIYELFDREITPKEMRAALPTWTPGIYRTEQLSERFSYSTIDWSRY